ncbi:MAG: cobalt ECF transporter T component CbiQ, partial [Clostridiales bacterium]|nr:cobalt ECF transporter T component CbiQ [Clostridiales bacterium]
YQAMRLRGFSGEYFTGIGEQLVISDFIWVTAWVLFFVAVSSYDLPALLGALFF